jgi:hypothetical protein
MSGYERVGCDLTHNLVLSEMGPASGMFLSARTAKSDGVDRDGKELAGVVGGRMSTFIAHRMLESLGGMDTIMME